MKKSFRLFLIQQVLFCLLISFQIRGQNLVPNPSFEDYNLCPDYFCQIHRATGWASWGYTPDYLNSCYPSWGNLSVPSNSWGYQFAADGNAYIAQYTYSSDALVREYSGIKLINPLIIGKKYFASVKVSLCDAIGIPYATNKLGLLFTTNSYAKDTSSCTYDLPLIPPNYAQVFSDSIITDKINWTTISGSFIADSAYEYIVLGNFFDNYNTDTIDFNNGGCCSAVYFFDDVSVVEDTSSDTTNMNESYQINFFSIYPNPAKDYIKISINNKIPATLKIFNIMGMEILSQKLYESENVINLSSLISGIYSVHILSSQVEYTSKLILTPKN